MMKAMTLDYDGVLATGSQEAKEDSWLTTVLKEQGEIAPEVFAGVRTGDVPVTDVQKLAKRYPSQLAAVQSLRGLSRKQTAIELVRIFSLGLTPEELTAERESIRGPLVQALIQPMPGAMDLVQKVSALGCPWGIVSQTTSASIRADLTRFAFPTPAVLECAGDPFYSNFREGFDPKVVAYAIACRRLDAPPEHVIAIEDSANGVRAAQQVGIGVVALVPSRAEHISEADMNLYASDLRPLASDKIVATLVREKPLDAFQIIVQQLGNIASL